MRLQSYGYIAFALALFAAGVFDQTDRYLLTSLALSQFALFFQGEGR